METNTNTTEPTSDELAAAADLVEDFFTRRPLESTAEELCHLLSEARKVTKHYIASPPASESVNANLLAACEAVINKIEQQPLRDIWLPKHAGSVEMAMECEAISDIHETLQTAIDAARAQAKDDAMPVDEEWLKRMKWKRREHTNALFLCVYPGRLFIDWSPDSGMMFIRTSTCDELPHIKTRGDVRRLLAALGVETKGVGE